MQRAVRTLLVVLRVLPTLQVAARHLPRWSDVLPKEELLLRHQFQAEGILQIEEADLLIFVVVEPVEYLFDHCLFGGEAPTLDDFGELINRYVASVMSIKLVESFPQGLVLGLELGQ